MELFQVNENDYTCRLNREWLYLIPEFSTILKKDKGGVQGDKGGQRKLWSRRRFAYIYFLVDFKSPIYTWDPEERHPEALRYTGLSNADVTEDYMVAAIAMYRELQYQASRSLRTLEAVNKGLKQLDTYFENINFEKVDKQGKVMYTAADYVRNIAMLNKAYDEIHAFEKRIIAELTKSGGIRGSATKGDRELDSTTSTARENVWEEGSNQNGKSGNWLDMATGTAFNDEL